MAQQLTIVAQWKTSLAQRTSIVPNEQTEHSRDGWQRCRGWKTERLQGLQKA